MRRLSPNDTLGTYTLVEKLGEGGMGAVWKARNNYTARVCALKVIRDDEATNADAAVRFEREVRLAASIDHPNVVRVFDPLTEGGRLALLMELVEGTTLQARLRPDAVTRVRLSVEETLAVMLPLCAGVAAIHARGIVHRDLKPANVMLARDHTGKVIPKIMDFGIAKPIADDAELTSAGVAPGSAAYMSPEQAQEQRDLDARADIYALGVLTYQMITGRRPIEETSRKDAVLALLGDTPFPRPRSLVPTIPGALEEVILKALARDRADRFNSATAYATALSAAAGRSSEETISASDASLIVPDPPSSPDGDTIGGRVFETPRTTRSRLPWALLGASVVCALCVVAWALVTTSAATPPPAATAAPTASRPPAIPTLAMVASPVAQPLRPNPPVPVVAATLVRPSVTGVVTDTARPQSHRRPRPGSHRLRRAISGCVEGAGVLCP